jgi:hypothetical protein
MRFDRPGGGGYVGEGVWFGLMVGALFAILEMVGAATSGGSPFAPWRFFASTLLGHRALALAPLGTAVMVGFVAHFALSAVYGSAFGYLQGRLGPELRRSTGRQTWIGLAFGFGLYLLNYQIIARVAYPWFRLVNQPWQVILHTFFFGLPLAMCFAVWERKHAGVTLRPASAPRRGRP